MHDHTSDTPIPDTLTCKAESILQAPKPFGICVVIDYRLSHRFRLRNFLVATNLFRTIEEPSTLHDCAVLLQRLPVDACIFGPTLKAERVSECIRKASNSTSTKRCTFIASRRHNKQETIEGIDSLIEFPCTQESLSRRIVQAIELVHRKSSAGSKSFSGERNRLSSLQQRVELSQIQNGAPFHTSVPVHGNYAWQRPALEIIAPRFSLFWRKLCEIQPFYLRFRSDASPTEFTAATVVGLIEDVFPNTDNIPAVADFKTALEQLLYVWIQLASQHDRHAANRRLMAELMHLSGLLQNSCDGMGEKMVGAAGIEPTTFSL